MNTTDYPEIIYKYRNWQNIYHRKILTDGEIYLAAPNSFNDPFDFGITKNFLTLDTKEKIEKYVDDGLKKHKDFLLSKGYNLAKEREFQLNRLKNIEEYQKEWENIEFNAINKYQGVLSLSGRWNSILMWSHYAENHKGFNIGYNEEKMRTSGIFGKGGPVIYSTDYPFIDPFEEHSMISSFQKSHYKSKEWEYEEEYRLTKLFYPNEPTEDERVKKIPFGFIEEINLGLKISSEDKDDILKIANEHDIKVYQIQKTPFKFELTRRLV
ncbi:DUF2971 domain-containing protein [Empedobacter falsenii]|uniref:Protein of uncharacterized function (DUF2971) n=1 Tax=Empedobacter falsenii TaxID=343874 RepID=A0A376GHM6_9FLAO|nr:MULTISPECIES: DUF2971 domain-containing protein [Empedobacter]MDM1041313.1 DUF2971 domain-containing protein [Empedobacter brevis]MDM1134623.1 DUF2971 domain-containing protein [Empedobacter sp. R750]STD59308.1 Protein of uncharacterised function (DUF2971) [Empedobacter falsenii]